ncbi:hypothetical protein [Tolypothrix sp. NIES-4075]|uniref:hypothetical protein n=1 Tax=Tolypothrix sp. NIES-4075 TaxID=2005459 RepID=UPI0013577B89|nr:hypothetical protein [Tolypothrix sp. NIES-4075]
MPRTPARQYDRQQPPKEIKQDRQVIQETRQEIKPDYQAMRDSEARSAKRRS